MNKYQEILHMLSLAPDTQIDGSAAAKLKAMADSDNPKADELHEILDECAYAALASDFAMVAMHRVWERMLADEARSVEQAMKDRPLRRWELN